MIGVAALVLGVDQLVDDGFGRFSVTDPGVFRILCVAFVLIAVLGLAITPAERALIEPANAGWSRFGAALTYLGVYTIHAQLRDKATTGKWAVPSRQSVRYPRASTNLATMSVPPSQARPASRGPVWSKCAVSPVSVRTLVQPYPGSRFAHSSGTGRSIGL